MEILTHMFNLIWHAEEVPADWKSRVIVTLSKKGNLGDCDNWRGITLLSIPGKVFSSEFQKGKVLRGTDLHSTQHQ